MQITPHVHALRLPFTIEAGPNLRLNRFVYSYLVVGKSILLIDAGVAGSQEKIFSYVESLGRKPEDIQLLLLTHAHPDHMGGAAEVVARTWCSMACHADAVAWVEDPELQNRERPVPGFSSLVAGPVKVSQTLADGETIQVADVGTLKALHTPGHSQGHLAFWLEEEGVLFSGDCLPPPGGLPIYEELSLLHDSLNTLEALETRHLLSSWDDPMQGQSASCAFQEGRETVARIHEAVMNVLADKPNLDSVSLAAEVFSLLGLPALPKVPPLLRTIEAHRRVVETNSH